jgi:hypothetical protein
MLNLINLQILLIEIHSFHFINLKQTFLNKNYYFIYFYYSMVFLHLFIILSAIGLLINKKFFFNLFFNFLFNLLKLSLNYLSLLNNQLHFHFFLISIFIFILNYLVNYRFILSENISFKLNFLLNDLLLISYCF